MFLWCCDNLDLKMARLATSAVQLCQRLQEMYPQKFQFPNKQSEQSSPFRRWTTGSGAGSSYRHNEHRGIYSKQMSEGSVSVQGNTSGGVARWSLGLEHLLADPNGAAAFAHFLAKEFAAENIRFWWSCEQYRCCEDSARRAALAAQIFERHLGERASEPVNVDAAARRAATHRHHAPLPADLFAQAQSQIFNVMKFDSYPRFLRSEVHAQCARADLRGLPCPYAPLDDASPKLKKSASNASERRRSGSLLPWKARAASRDRTISTASNAEENTTTDVVKSSQTMNGQSLLCRVWLPDGATSVVPVDGGATVKRLVDRLLQRRNLDCTAYDVVLKDENPGEDVVIDSNTPSVAVGGRCVAVERRCVVRVAVAGRAVAVRCRPARRLRHVLRPVLHKYCPAVRHYAVLLGDVAVHPDTLVQDLDGKRVQVVEMAGAGGGAGASGAGEGVGAGVAGAERDDDADSLSDVALRQDENEDAQSACRSSVSSSCTTGSGGIAEFDGTSAQGGRVRAALRPGPPLHHHPPDFLENLRETQRQRLVARTPPPLPPKPAPRQAPTVV